MHPHRLKPIALLKRWCLSALFLASFSAWSQKGPAPEWVEEAPPAAPAFSSSNLLPITMPPHISVKVGVDPDTITVGNDGVVRYVVVMVNASGSLSAAYEGIRCVTDEVKLYARQYSSGSWTAVTEAVWKPLNDNQPSKHAFAFARQAACKAKLTQNKRDILNALSARPIPATPLIAN